MKIKNILIAILFVIIFTSGLIVNIAFVQNKKIVETTKFTIDSIYFDISLIENKNKASEIEKFIDSKNINLFTRIINQKENPAAQFYAFCALMRTDQQKAKSNLEKLLINPKKVTIIVDKDSTINDSYLGYAVLLILKSAPNNLIKIVDSDFFKFNQKVMQKAYQSQIVQNNADYKNELLNYVKPEDVNVTVSDSKIVKLIQTKQFNDMTDEEKRMISNNINNIPENNKPSIVKAIFQLNNEELILNALRTISENDSKDVAYAIKDLFSGNYSYDINKLIIQKYTGILKAESLQSLRDYMSNLTSTDLIVLSLNTIEKYGDDSNYDFLKNYLKITYPESVNIAALTAITATTYKTRPDDVLNTMSFVLRKIEKPELAYQAVKFHIDNNLTKNSASVLYRLKLKENIKMKKLALDYMDKFNLQEGYSLLRELMKDDDQDISGRAKKILDKYGAGYEESNQDETGAQ